MSSNPHVPKTYAQHQSSAKEESMSKCTIRFEESTTNQTNVIRLVGHHQEAGSQLLASREHSMTTGYAHRFAGIGVNHKKCDENEWPAKVYEAVKSWKEKCKKLDEANIAADTVGRELFAAFVTEEIKA